MEKIFALVSLPVFAKNTFSDPVLPPDFMTTDY
jgi:hypothetical protein